MAALKENLLSPWHLTHKERDPLSTSTKRGERSLKRSEHRRMELQGDSTFQRDQHLRTVQLQKRWQQLEERERRARQHNRQLLQEFEKAQDTLRDMVARTATMNTIRMEYERYLEENSPRWQQQLKEKTLSAQKKQRMEEYLTECLKRTEEEQVRSSAEAQPSLSQGPKQPQKTAAPQRYHSQNSHPDHDEDDSSHLRGPSMQSSWLTHRHSHSASFPSRMPSDPQGSSYVPLSFYPHPVFQQPHHFSSTSSHRHSVPQQGPPGWSALQMDHTRAWRDGVAGFPPGTDTVWSRPFMAEPPGWGVVQGVEEEAESSTRPSSVRGCGKGGRSSGLSQELDIKPVRLSSGQKESSESGRDSSQASRKNGSREKRKKREKRGRTDPSSSDKEDSSQESSRTSSAVVVASASVAQGSGSDTSSGQGSSSRSRRGRKRSGGLSVKPPRTEKPKERTSTKGDSSGSCKEDCPSPEEDSGSEEEESKSEITGNESPDDKSESCREESGSPMEKSGSGSEKVEDGGAEETEEEQESGGNQSSTGDKDEEEEGHEEVVGTRKDVEQADDDEENEGSSQTDDEEASGRKNTAEEETGEEDEEEEQESEGQEEDEEQSGREMYEGSENDKEGSATSQDGEMEEGGGKGNADEIEEDEELDEEEEGEGEEEEEQRSEEAGRPEEERDSDDSIILPQVHRSKNMIHSIPEEGEATSEDEDDDGEEESKKECSDDSLSEFKDEDDDIENLLAPQAETQRKEEKDLKADDKPKDIIEDLDNLSVELDRETKTNQEDSDEFDHFYD